MSMLRKNKQGQIDPSVPNMPYPIHWNEKEITWLILNEENSEHALLQAPPDNLLVHSTIARGH